MIESSGEFPEIRPSKSMSLLPPPNIETKIIKQIGNYILGVELGSGAFGKVVLAKHIITGEDVAIKILDKIILNQTPEDYELVKNEMSILKLVKHKYIIQLYEILQTPNHIFIAMEYCEGKDIMDYILSRNYLTELDALKYFQQLINALFYLHSQNIAHRDIKIDNILLDRNKNLKLIDFGLSTKYSDDKLLDQPCGTIVYSAPEVLEGKPYHGMLADVWSSGIVLYGMLSGYLPFSDNDDNINKQLIIEGKIEMPENISPCAKDLLKHMLDVNPMTRYTLQDIKEHPWFNMKDFFLIQGIIIGYHKVPVDEYILDLCEYFNFDKNKIRNSVLTNKFDSGSALYYLLVRQRNRKGITSVSDLYSEKFINFIYNNDNLIQNITKKHENKNKTKSKEENNIDINENMKKHESNLSAAPGLANNVNVTPKKNKKKNILSFDNNMKNNSKNSSKNNSKKNIIKKSKKIKLYSSINKKSVCKIKNSNNFISNFFDENRKTENNFNYYTNKVFPNNKTKYKINININNNQINNNKNYLNSHKIDNHQSKINQNKNTHSPNTKEKFVINNKKRTPIKIKRKERINIGNSFIESSIPNDLNQQLSLKELLIKTNIEEEYSSTNNSNHFKNKINSKEKLNNKIYYSKNNTQKLPKSNKKMIKTTVNTNNNTKKKNNNDNSSSVIKLNKSNSKNAKVVYRNIDHSLINKFEMSKSIETKEKKNDVLRLYKEKVNNQINKNNISKYISNNDKDKTKEKAKSVKYNNINIDSQNKKNKSKNTTPINKILRNTINYLSNKVSTTNSHDKKKFKTNIKLQTRNDRNTPAFSNYTKSCSHSTNNINNNYNNNTTNNLNSKGKAFLNNFKIYNLANNKKISNLKQKLAHAQYDLSYNLINNNEIKDKSILINYFKEGKNNKIYKTFYNNNIKLVKNNKNLNKNSNYFGINNTILNEIKTKIHHNIKQPQVIYDKNQNNKNYNAIISVEKNKNKMNQNLNAKTENISIILVNSKSVIKPENLTSPNHNKIKPKIKHCRDSFIEDRKEKEKNKVEISSNKKRHFESSVITYRYQSPIVTRGLSESPKQKYLNEKTRCSQLPWKIKKKGIDEKISEEIIYKKYINKIKKNPFILNNNKIKNREKIVKIRALSNNNNKNKNKSSSMNKSKTKNKIKYYNNSNKINVCYSKENLHTNAPNINYKLNSPHNQNMKNKMLESNNQSLNFLDIKTFPLLKAINKKYYNNTNKRIYHRNTNNFNISNTNNTNTNTNNTNMTNNNYFYNFSISTSMSMNSIAFFRENQKNNKNEIFIFDLSCMIFGQKNINECCANLENKLRKNGIYFTLKKNNIFSIYKNGECCEIEIVQLFSENNSIIEDDKIIKSKGNKDLPIFYYRIIKKKGGFNLNKFFSNIILSP